MNKIISFVMIGSNDFKKSSKFYDAIFVPLKIKKIIITERYIGYGQSSEPKDVKFYITRKWCSTGEAIGYYPGVISSRTLSDLVSRRVFLIPHFLLLLLSEI